MNKVKLTGVFMGVDFSHESHKEKFYTGYVGCKRNSGVDDIIPITISERLLNDQLTKGQRISLEGEFRSYNKYVDGKNRCILSVFVRSISDPAEQDFNQIELEGYICKNSECRTTPQNRRITDVIVAVNRLTKKSDYIPCIVWNDKAEYVSTFPTGTEVSILGRIQSRNYDKKTSDGHIETRTAYEVSISEIGKIDPICDDVDFNDDDFSDIFEDLEDLDE